MPKAKKYDLVLFGATGFVGELTAEYLSRAARTESFTWAIAGRSQLKLERLKKRLAAVNPDVRTTLDIVQADIHNQDSLNSMAATAKVVLSTVGPYIHYGEPVVQACVKEGADYADLTGEPEFVEKMRQRYDELAKRQKLRIVNSCGFDSIPHDYGVFYTLEMLKQRHGKSVEQLPVKVEGFVRASGEFSGGTWHSAIHAFSRAGKLLKQVRQSPDDEVTEVKGVFPLLRHPKELKAWGCPFPTIDPQVVKRSARTMQNYGSPFRYGHYVRVKRLPRVLMGASVVGGIFALSQLKPTREFLLNIKKQGDGPTREKMDRSWFKVDFLSEVDGHKMHTRVSGGDPGYMETAAMLAETGLCLAHDRRRTPRNYGVITPVAAMGKPLLGRLQSAGIKFEVIN